MILILARWMRDQRGKLPRQKSLSRLQR